MRKEERGGSGSKEAKRTRLKTVEERRRRGEKQLLVGGRGQIFEKRIPGNFVVCGEMKFFLEFLLKRISTKTYVIFK